ncbi:hypothetical protein CDIK_2534 [Cucumispora dikerogammari]|nr:hypothetical protein CDIK_2534 [Cucumispora dikerogammari]
MLNLLTKCSKSIIPDFHEDRKKNKNKSITAHSKILNEIEKLRRIVFLMTNTVSLGLTSVERLSFKEKARLFVFENRLLMIIKNSVKKNYLCEHEIARMKETSNLFHLPGYLGRNALKEAISTQYIGVFTRFTYNSVNLCIYCQRESVYVPSTPLTPIVSNFVRERLIVDTINLSEYEESNDVIKYIGKIGFGEGKKVGSKIKNTHGNKNNFKLEITKCLRRLLVLQ